VVFPLHQLHCYNWYTLLHNILSQSTARNTHTHTHTHTHTVTAVDCLRGRRGSFNRVTHGSPPSSLLLTKAFIMCVCVVRVCARLCSLLSSSSTHTRSEEEPSPSSRRALTDCGIATAHSALFSSLSPFVLYLHTHTHTHTHTHRGMGPYWYI